MSPMIQEMANRRPIRITRASARPSRRAPACCPAGSLATRMAMKTTLSMPRTISMAVRVTSAIRASAVTKAGMEVFMLPVPGVTRKPRGLERRKIDKPRARPR